MGNMGDSELKNVANMAQAQAGNMGMPGGMPGMGGMPPQAPMGGNTTAAASPNGSDVPSDCKDNYN